MFFASKVVNTDVSDGALVTDALWSSESRSGITTVLRSVSRYDYVWERGYRYRFTISHNPVSCTARVLIMDEYYIVADSGLIYDCTFRGGRVGVFSFNQDEVEWQDLEYHCFGMLAIIRLFFVNLLLFVFSLDD